MSVTTGLTPETLTFDEIKRWSAQEMKDQMKRSDDMRAAVLSVVRAQSLSDIEAAQAQIESNQTPEIVPSVTDEQAAAAEQQRLAAEAEAQQAAARETEREAALKAENEQLAIAGVSVSRDQYGNIAKLIQDYQATDDNGNPIGRPTHLEARGWPELVAKQREAHIQATRAFHRLKGQKIQFKEQQPVSQTGMSDQELLDAMKDLKSDDPKKQLGAIQKVQQAERAKQDAADAEFKRQAAVSQRFLANHKTDFYNCQANINLVKEYFEQNPELIWTDDNLEVCLLAIESKLAPFPQESTAFTPPANPVVTAPAVQPVSQVAPTVISPTASPAVQPGATVPAQVPAANNPPAATPRPGVNGGFVPGESSASRPVTSNQPKALTAEEIRSWDAATMKAKLKDPIVGPQIKAFIAARNQGRR